MQKSVSALGGSFQPRVLLKILMIMKLTLFFVLFAALQVKAYEVSGQTVTLNFKQTEIRKVLNALEKESNYNFLYNYELKALRNKVDFKVENLPINVALDQLLANSGLTYKMMENNLVVVLSSDDKEKQDVRITGTVTGESNEPLAGVSVREKGTSTGTTTNNNGTFELTVSANATLEFSYIGYITQEVPVGDQQVFNIKLAPSKRELDQIVVIGYGSQRKKDVTSAISTVDTKDISSRPIVNTAEVMAGKAPGVQVFQPSGRPGSDFSVRVRGIASALGSSQPIYVIDGVITPDTKGLDPNTIESISVLKDASAAGIYGSAGATNGVVMISTKKGSKGKSRIDVNAYTGFQKIVKKLDLLNGQQLATLLEDEKHNGGDPAFAVDPSLLQTNTDWQDEVYRSAPMTGVNVGFGGGSDKGTFYLNLGYLNQDGIVKMSNFVRYSVKLNLEQNMNKWFTIGTHLNYNRTNSQDVPDNSRVNQGGVVLGALSTPPFVGKYNSDGTFAMNPFQAWENPLASIEGPYNKTIANNFLGDAYAEIKLPYSLKFRTQFAVNTNNYNYDYFLDPFRTQYGRSKNGIGQNNYGEFFRWTWENTVTWNKSFNDHNFTVVAGTSAIEDKRTDASQYGEGFATSSITTLNAASSNKSISTFKSESSLNSYFGRINYDYNGKYLLTASLRADGSSRSGINNQWGYFPAISAGWRVSNEDFMSGVNAIQDLKLRAGWGATGNPSPENYASYSLFETWPNYSFGGIIVPGVTPGALIGNPELTWEQTKQFNIGFDLTTLQNRLTFSADYYNKKTRDLIFQENVPMSAGGGYRYANAPGFIENSGFEFSLNGIVVNQKDFTWNSSLNMSFNKNEAKELDSGRVIYFGTIPERGYSIVLKEGLPLGAFWGFISDGVDPANGNIKFRDLNGDGVIDPDNDRAYLGTALPKYTLGFSNEFAYKNISLNILIDGVFGNKVLNATRIETEGMFDVKNASAATLGRWMKPGDVTDIPVAVFSDPDQNSRISTRFIESGSFIRFRNVTLSYRIANNTISNWGMSGLRLYVTAQNLYTFSNYKGYHPEVNASGTSAVEQGIDYGTYPQARVFTFGINLELQ